MAMTQNGTTAGVNAATVTLTDDNDSPVAVRGIWIENTGSYNMLVNVPAVHAGGDFETIRPGQTAFFESHNTYISSYQHKRSASNDTTFNQGIYKR